MAGLMGEVEALDSQPLSVRPKDVGFPNRYGTMWRQQYLEPLKFSPPLIGKELGVSCS